MTYMAPIHMGWSASSGYDLLLRMCDTNLCSVSVQMATLSLLYTPVIPVIYTVLTQMMVVLIIHCFQPDHPFGSVNLLLNASDHIINQSLIHMCTK